MIFGWIGKSKADEEAIRTFEDEIARQQDFVYGAELFFECISLLHEDQPAVVETHRKEFRNIIQKGTEVIEKAKAVLAEARNDRRKIEQIRQFMFTPCAGHPDPEKLMRRAKILVETCRKIFPGRSMSQELSREEILRLMEEAADAFHAS